MGEITGFTGINDPYESLHPEITLDMVVHTEVENARMILDDMQGLRTRSASARVESKQGLFSP